MRHLYHPSASDPAIAADSYWAASAPPLAADVTPLSGTQSCDVAVIGGGYTGLSAAYHLARDHGLDVRVLERAEPGWGASGRNGGFCCFGSSKVSYETIAKRVGEAEATRFYRTQREAIELVAELTEREEIDVQRTGHGDVEIAHKAGEVEGLKAHLALLRRVLGVEGRLYGKEELREAGFASPQAHAAATTPLGFGLHPLRYARGLAAAAARHGARIHGRSGVEAWEKDGETHVLHTPGGTLRARQVVVATNGYTTEDLHAGMAGKVLPALSNVITTRPLSEAELEAQGWTSHTMASDSRNLLHYFRLLPDKRMLLGSRGGLSADPGTEAAKRADMRKRLGMLFPEWKDVEISHFWRGFVCMAADLTPHVGRLPDDGSVIHALAYHGNGVAMSSWSGRAAARLAAGQPPEEVLPAVMRKPLPRFPLPGLRPLYLRAAYAGFWLKDEVL